MSRYQPISSGEDVGFHDSSQPRPTSARRYTVDRPSSIGTQRLQPAGQPASPTRPVRQTIDVVRDGDEMYYQSSYARPRRAPSTRDDPRVTTNLKPVPRPVSRRKLVVGGLGLVIGTLIAGDWALNTWDDMSLLMAQGPEPTRNLPLVCGHGGDSPDHPTLLHAFIEEYVLRVTEYPAGKNVGTHGVTCEGLPTTGDYKKWKLQLNAQKVQGRYQVIISVQIPGEPLLHEWILVDSGKGYFVAANPK